MVIPKIHQPSYVVQMDTDAYLALHLAAREAARCLDNAFEDVARTGIMYEGYGVDHAHAKLFPMHGTAGNEGASGEPCTPQVDIYFHRYEGYLSSHDHARVLMTQNWLVLAERIERTPVNRIIPFRDQRESGL